MIWPTSSLEVGIRSLWPGFSIQVLPEIDSTNSELMRRARLGLVDPVLLVAERQTAGRGRLGRSWQSDGAALTFSLGLPLAPADWSGLSLAVGIAVAQSLSPRLRLKWPNDVWLGQRKLAGILIETASFSDVRYAVIGVGINIGPVSSEGLATPAAWLGELLPGIDAAGALQRLLSPLAHAIQTFAKDGFAPLQTQFHALDVLAGCEVTLSDGGNGRAMGVDQGGALLVHTVAGQRRITSTEVRVRPAGDVSPE